MIDTHATEKSGKRRIFYGWYMVAASIAANTIFSAAYFQGFGVLILPIERTFGWDRWVVSAAMSLRQLESGIVSPAVGFLLDRFSARKRSEERRVGKERTAQCAVDAGRKQQQ